MTTSEVVPIYIMGSKPGDMNFPSPEGLSDKLLIKNFFSLLDAEKEKGMIGGKQNLRIFSRYVLEIRKRARDGVKQFIATFSDEEKSRNRFAVERIENYRRQGKAL